MSRHAPPPPSFDESFLAWFREATERAWAECETPTLESFQRAGIVVGCDYQRGTRWTGGLSEAQVEAIERAWSLRFPPDYRLFLRTLHATTPPRVGVGYPDGLNPQLFTCPGFYDWLREADEIRTAMGHVFEGLLFDVENFLWRPSWGPRPDASVWRRVRLRELVDAAPRLVPVYGHRMLVAEPCRAGNPVLSVYQSDIIVYGADLRTYLLREFGKLLTIEPKGSARPPGQYAGIPFWGEFLF